MKRNKTALVLIDLQKESNFGLDGLASVIENADKLIRTCRSLNIPIIYTRQINRVDRVGLSKGEPLNQDGTPYFYASNNDSIEIFDEIKPEQEDIVIDKYRWSAFHETNLDLILKGLDVEELMIGGLVTDGCLMTSVFDAYFRDYEVHLIHDLCATSNEGAHMASIMIMTNWVYNINVYNTENIIKKLNGEPFTSLKPSAPDSYQFTPENMRETFTRLIDLKG
jgi:nicotinamidase-related amidase